MASEPQNAIIYLRIRNVADNLKLTDLGFPSFSGFTLPQEIRWQNVLEKEMKGKRKKKPQRSRESHSRRRIVLLMHKSLER